MKQFLALLLFPLFGLSQIPAYYSTVDFTQTGDALKAQLATLITDTHTTELQYTPGVWNAVKQADLDPDNTENVFLIYGYNDNDTNTDNDRTRDKDLSCHTSSCAGLWVREHVYPRSLGNPNLEFEGPGSDAHHLRPIDYAMNSSRSNRPFADGSGHSTTMAGGYFYPGDEWKGDVARMMMYMYVRYGTRCMATEVGTGSTSYSYYGDMPNIFLEWNAEDPVGQHEINRNNVLQVMQGNRNPFIDNPYLATLIWNGPNAQDSWGNLATGVLTLAEVFVYPTLTSGTLHIENAETGHYTFTLYNSLGQQVTVKNDNNTLNLAGNAAGLYFLNISMGNASRTFRIVLQ